MNTLLHAIRDRRARVAVIGLGYVGTPVACVFARAGFHVVAVEIVREKVEQVNRGVIPIGGDEPGLAGLLREVVRLERLRATTDYEVCGDAQVIIVAVETPVDDETRQPRYDALRSALRSIGKKLRPGTLVIVESTIAPGTMQGVVRPIIEEASGLLAGRDLFLVHCPERVMPGRLLRNLESMARVVGGWTPEASELAIELYQHVVKADLDATDSLTAEMVKTTENAYRDVQIAFANTVALISEHVGADVWKVRELVNKSPGRAMLVPGAGVGGHCIPKDPWLLAHGAPDGLSRTLIEAARAVNDSMPLHVARLALRTLTEAGRDVRGARIAVLGYAYAENSNDTRNSPTAPLIERLKGLGAAVAIHDPYVPEYAAEISTVTRGADAIIVMVAHDNYRALDLKGLRPHVRTPVLVDGRHVFSREQARQAGFVYAGVGEGSRDETGIGESSLDSSKSGWVAE